jgi:polyisoprenoid-binding protein YceI
MLRSALLIATLAYSASALASAPAWQIVPKDSAITFTAIQNNAPVEGSFKSFTGDIKFDPKQLATSKVTIQIDVSSLISGNPDIIKTLLSADWFDATKYPKAVFTSDHFVSKGQNDAKEETFQAEGNLTIRDKTLPATLSFVLKEYSSAKAQVIGSTTLKRSAFGVGQGDWASPAVVQDDVKINFKITAIPGK